MSSPLTYSLIWADKRTLTTFGSLVASLRPRVVQALQALSGDPSPSGVKKLFGALACVFGDLRIGDWRILYGIDDQARRIILIDIGPRKRIDR